MIRSERLKDRIPRFGYWDYENKLANAIQERLKGDLPTIDPDKLHEYIQRIFPDAEDQGLNWQKIAAAVAVLKPFSVITGGPGSGKTFTIAGILALLLASTRGTHRRFC